MSNFNIEFTNQDQSACRLVCAGELVLNDAVDFQQVLLDVMGRCNRVELDLSKVEELDLACSQLLFAAAKTAKDRGKEFGLAAPFPETVRQNLDQLGLGEPDWTLGSNQVTGE